jgi:hypothetical protein
VYDPQQQQNHPDDFSPQRISPSKYPDTLEFPSRQPEPLSLEKEKETVTRSGSATLILNMNNLAQSDQVVQIRRKANVATGTTPYVGYNFKSGSVSSVKNNDKYMSKD